MFPQGNSSASFASRWRARCLRCLPLLLLWGGGCAPEAQSGGAEAPSSAPSREEIDQALADYPTAEPSTEAGPIASDASASAVSPSRSLHEPPPPASRFVVTRIVAEEAPPPHAGTRRRIDVKLRRADLQEALRFLAHAGGFNLVIGEGVSGEVTAELKRVTPYDALQVIARAHGARVVHTRPAGGSSIVLVEPDR